MLLIDPHCIQNLGGALLNHGLGFRYVPLKNGNVNSESWEISTGRGLWDFRIGWQFKVWGLVSRGQKSSNSRNEGQ